MRCVKCDSEVRPGANFCPRCGADQRAVEPPRLSQPPPIKSDSPDSIGAIPPPRETAKAKLPSKWWVIGVGLVVSIATLVAGMALLLRSKRPPSIPNVMLDPAGVAPPTHPLAGDFVQKCKFYAGTYRTDVPVVAKIGTISAHVIKGASADEVGKPELTFNGQPTGISDDRIEVIAYGKLRGNAFLLASTSPDLGATTEVTPKIVILSIDGSGSSKQINLAATSEVTNLDAISNALSEATMEASITPDGSSVLFNCGGAGSVQFDGRSMKFMRTETFVKEQSKKATEADALVQAKDLGALVDPTFFDLFKNKQFREQFKKIAGDRLAREVDTKLQLNTFMSDTKRGPGLILANGWAKPYDWYISLSSRNDVSEIQGFILDKEHGRLEVFGVANANLLSEELKQKLKEIREL